MKFERSDEKEYPKVTIIVMNYNGRDFLEGCFSSLLKLDYPAFVLVMADGNSEDDSVSFVSRKFPQVRILKSAGNLGVCKSFNDALKKVKTDLVVKVDNDIVVDKNWLKAMVLALNQNPKIGVVGSKILHYGSDKIQDIGSNIDRFGYQTNYYTMEGLPKDGSKIKEAFYVSGCSMLFRKRLFEEVGGLDEKFFLYKDDLDFCWRMKLLGYKVVTNLDSQMYHLSGVVAGGTSVLDQRGRYHTTARKRYFGERNTLRMLIKNYSNSSLLKILPVYLLIIFAEVFLFTLIGKLEVAKAYLNAVWWNIQNLSDTWREHNKIQAMRIESDRAIMKDMIRGSAKLKYFRTIGIPKFG